jgi:hypothetical protein
MMAMSKLSGHGVQHSLFDLSKELSHKSQAVAEGNLRGAESMLMSQAHALQSIFTEMVMRSSMNMGEYMVAAETYMRLALKAQAQCTRTLEVLGAMKNPPVVIAKQANIAQGPQQVNNLSAPAGEKTENELYKADYETVDNGEATTPGIAYQNVETMGAINRPKVRARKGEG